MLLQWLEFRLSFRVFLEYCFVLHLLKIFLLRLLIIDNYDSFTFNLVQLIEQCGCFDYQIVKNDELLKTDFKEFNKILISPGPGIANEAGELMEFLNNNFKQKSILGICLGYEAIGELFGAKLSKLPEPMHGIQNNGSTCGSNKIFNGLPDSFKIGHYHSWIFNEQDIPSSLHIILKDELGLPMAVCHETYDITGLQFHPESIMTEFGKEMINNWLNL